MARILIADDNTGLRDVLVEMAQGMGHTAQGVADGGIEAATEAILGLLKPETETSESEEAAPEETEEVSEESEEEPLEASADEPEEESEEPDEPADSNLAVRRLRKRVLWARLATSSTGGT